MSATPLRSVGPTPPTLPDPDPAPAQERGSSAKLVGIAVVTTVVLLSTLAVGIVIGNVARKRYEKWSRGY